MRHFKKHTGLFLATLLLLSSAAQASDKRVAASRLTPEKVGLFKVLPLTASPAPPGVKSAGFAPGDYGVRASAAREYEGPNGERFLASVVETASPSAAYSLLQREAAAVSGAEVRLVEGLGLLGFGGADALTFVKGTTLVTVRASEGRPFGREAALLLSRGLAEKIEGEAGFVPSVVLHLPEWEKKVSEGVGYAMTLPALKEFAGDRPALEAVSFEGGAEAATAKYGDARLVIVEFSTPQHSAENDARISERVGQLRVAGQPTPSFYGRVGNYSVFVFDAANEAAARELASGVAYEKDVRWLGPNPHEDEIVQRLYTRTMGGVIVTTLATTGVAILICLGLGGLIGTAVFIYRRTRPGAREAYSDAGGMMRLNLDDFDTPGGSAKLLGPKGD